jgi:sensor histidine kinase YesM
LQPLVENSIRHGLMKRIDGGIVKLFLGEKEGFIYAVVEDNGIGISQEKIIDLLKNDKIQGGVGLKNIQRRLLNFYGTGLDIQSKENEGTKIILKIPKE